MILYFIPQNSKAKAKAPDHCTTSRDVQKGPGGQNGTIFSDGSGKTGFYPDMQEWVAVDDYYVGVDRDTITPSDLARPEIVDGHFVRLEDGNEWLIPCARVFPSGTRLPESLILGPDGQLVSEVLPRFAEFSKDADRVYDFFLGEYDILQGDAWNIAVKALNINYRIDKHEVSLLKLLTTTNITKIMKAIIDYPAVEEAAKKKLQDDGSLNDGNVD